MAQHPFPCEICAQLEDIGQNRLARFVAELPSGYVVLGPSQYFRGYTLLLAKSAAPDLEDLEWPQRLQFLRDVAVVSEAVAAVCQPHKMNVESLGNVVPHLHFHFFPRYETEKSPENPVWLAMPDADEAEKYAFSPEKHGQLIEKLRAKIAEIDAARA